MAVTADRVVTVTYSGTVNGVNPFEADSNTTSPGMVQYIDLASGNNNITKPTGALGVTVVFPVGNTTIVTLKGTTADTGLAIHPTDPTSIGLASTVTTFVLSAASTLSAVRLFWS